MIAIDWGTSNFRAFRIDGNGEVVERLSSPAGILRVEEGRFEQVMRSEIAPWLAAGERQILLCGMVGSRQGWIETSYLPCPVALPELASNVVKIPLTGLAAYIVPGVIGTDSDGFPEMMRGEETAALGVFHSQAGTATVCLPGTHSKWIHIKDGAIVSFTTSMTGDVFSALRTSTILSRLMADDDDTHSESFLRGVARSGNAGGLLHHLFSVRALTLTHQLQENTAAAYLSGLLIGHEVREAMPKAAHVSLIGDGKLCSLYAQAIRACGGSSKIEEQYAAARGLAAIGRKMLWT